MAWVPAVAWASRSGGTRTHCPQSFSDCGLKSPVEAVSAHSLGGLPPQSSLLCWRVLSPCNSHLLCGFR